MQTLNLRKIAAFSIGPVGAAILGFCTLPIIAWLFEASDVGRFAMLNIAAGFGTLLFCLGLDQAYVREFHEENDSGALFKAAIFPGLLLLIISLVVIQVIGIDLAQLVFDQSEPILTACLIATIVSAYLFRFFSLILRMNEKGYLFSLGQILPKIVLLIFLGFFIYTGLATSLNHIVLATSVGFIITCLTFAFITRGEWARQPFFFVDYKLTRRMLKFGLPLTLGGLAYWGLTTVDKVALRTLSTFDELGIYSVAVSFASATTIVQAVFTTIWAPTVFKWAKNGENFDKIQLVVAYVSLCVTLIFCSAGLMSWITTLLLPSYYFAVEWLVLACLGAPLLYTMSEATVVGLSIGRRTGLAMVAAIFSFAVNFLGNYFLIPVLGAAGAATSTCFAFWIFLILRTEFSIRVWKPIPRFKIYSLSALCVFGSIFSAVYGIDVYPYIYLYWLCILLLSVFFYRIEIAVAVEYFKRNGRLKLD